ncbi:MAG: hypothetical protein PHI12_08615 [Dehalococcoidales bacterium]|nr:hypothetical protein [Dehalococcoidales bacterium]
MASMILLAQRFWLETQNRWPRLSEPQRKQWLNTAVFVATQGFQYAVRGTDIKAPAKYEDLATEIKTFDGDTEKVYSTAMYYGKFNRQCRNTWNAEEVKVALSTLAAILRKRDTGKW